MFIRLFKTYQKIKGFNLAVPKHQWITTSILCANVPTNLRQYYADTLMLILLEKGEI